MTKVFFSTHGQYRSWERNFDVHEAKKIAKSGKVTDVDENDIITKEGTIDGRKLIVICKNLGKRGIMIITAYYED